MSTAYERLVDLLEWPGEPGRRDALCPAHDDSTASLSITDAGDHVLAHCFAGCETRDVLAELGLPMAALYDRWWSRSRARQGWASWT